MRRKRLKHAAQVLCQMFCGWRLINSCRDLERLGSGVLGINALDGSCSFNGEPVSSTAIARELQSWLEADLDRHGIPRGALRSATLTATLQFSSIQAGERVTRDRHFGRNGEAVAGPFNRVAIACSAELTTDDGAYSAEHDDLEEWPTGWPAR